MTKTKPLSDHDEDLAILLEMLTAVMSQPLPKAYDPKPVFAWQGGKRWLVKELMPMIPPHKTYAQENPTT